MGATKVSQQSQLLQKEAFLQNVVLRATGTVPWPKCWKAKKSERQSKDAATRENLDKACSSHSEQRVKPPLWLALVQNISIRKIVENCGSIRTGVEPSLLLASLQRGLGILTCRDHGPFLHHPLGMVVVVVAWLHLLDHNLGHLSAAIVADPTAAAAGLGHNLQSWPLCLLAVQ